MPESPHWLHRLWTRRPAWTPSVPAGARVYAVGDIHGRYDLLQQLLALIDADAGPAQSSNTLIFLGDYIDRGPQSREVVELLQSLTKPDWEIIALRGNHEQMALAFCEDAGVYRTWRDYGGGPTLASYGVRPPAFDNAEEFAKAREAFVARLPPAHRDFFNALPYSHTIGDYLFVHAGIRPDVPIDRQSPQDMMWIRQEFLWSGRVSEKIVVHGHSPSGSPAERKNRIGIDTGAYATGRLTALVLEGETRRFLSTKNA